MSESSEIEETKVNALVIGAHASYNQKFGATSGGIILAATVMAFIQKSFWPLAIGVIVSFVVSYLMRLSCYRRIEQVTGLPSFAQDHIIALYKHDKQFAAAVDHALNDAKRNISEEFVAAAHHELNDARRNMNREKEFVGMQCSPERLSKIVSLYPSVYGELTAREPVFRLNFDDKKRRQIMPFNSWGREFMQQEEFDIWTSLSQGMISEAEAIEKITDIMEKYYGAAYPLR